MSRRTHHINDPARTSDATTGAEGPAETVSGALRRAIATRARRWILVITLLLGALTAVAVAVALPAGERSLAAVASPTHMIMSIVLPFLGVVLARDLLSHPATRVLPTLTAAVVTAAAVALAGDLMAVASLAAAGSATPGAWADAAVILLGAVLVQSVATLTGTGLGVLIRPAWVACLATIVIPLGVWALLGPAGTLRDWITPFPAAGTLLSGEMAPADWLRWAVAALIWGVGLNTLAAWAVHRRRPA